MFHILPISPKLKNQFPNGYQRAITIGGFDGVHLGHQAIIGRLIANANTRGLVSSLMIVEPQAREFFERKYNLPLSPRIMSLAQKITKINNLQKLTPLLPQIDELIILRFIQKTADVSAEDFINILESKLRIKYWLLGEDFHFGKNRQGNLAYLQNRKNSFEVDFIENINDEQNTRYSSTKIRRLLKQGDFALAKIALGEDYWISGRVQKGLGLGRKLLIPTANIHFKYPPPLFGVFAGYTKIIADDDFEYPSVINIGRRPSVESNGIIKLESHLLISPKTELYKKKIQIRFTQKIRDEKKFDNFEDLKKQIFSDIDFAKSTFNL